MSILDVVLGRHYEKKANENGKILKFSEVIIPFGAFDRDEVLKELYYEGVQCHLLGFSNASMLIMVSCLERTIRRKCQETEKGKTSNEKGLYQLLEWLEGHQRDLGIHDINIPHGFRLLRNIIAHKQKLINGSDASEGIKYVSKIMNGLYNYKSLTFSESCEECGDTTEYEIEKEDAILGGDNLSFDCGHCELSRFSFKIGIKDDYIGHRLSLPLVH